MFAGRTVANGFLSFCLFSFCFTRSDLQAGESNSQQNVLTRRYIIDFFRNATIPMEQWDLFPPVR
jgi:hypothetical protein